MGPAGLCATSKRRRLCRRPRSTIEKFNLDRYEIATLSPLRVLSDHMPSLRLFVGGDELPELKQQSATYAEAGGGSRTADCTWRLAGTPPLFDPREACPVGGNDHARTGQVDRSKRMRRGNGGQARAPIWHMVVHALKIGICRRTEQFIPQGHLRCEHWCRGLQFLAAKGRRSIDLLRLFKPLRCARICSRLSSQVFLKPWSGTPLAPRHLNSINQRG
jgi:hypothetical protein